MEFAAGISRRHLVAGAIGALALPIATRAVARGIEEPATEADTSFMRMAIAEAALCDYPFGTAPICSRERRTTSRANPAQCAWGRSSGAESGRVLYGASIVQLATKTRQTMVTDSEIANKTPFLDIAITGGVLAAEAMKLFK